MARCLKAYHWAEEPLNGEVPYKSDDIIVEESDIEESPYTKAERNRRREAIGRRYLLGHIPLIQTASLKGPFGSTSGWATPWGRIKVGLKDQKLPTSTRNKNEDINTREAIDAESETLEVENSAEAHIEEDLHDKHIDDDAVRYDADNEDDAFEEMNDEETHLLDRAEHLNGTRAKHTYLSHDHPHSWKYDDDILDVSEEEVEQPIQCTSSKDSERTRRGFLQNDRKRKVDTGWLKGANVLKRSRYEGLEHSSPTPAAGIIGDGNRRLHTGSSLQSSNLETLDGQENSQPLPIPNTNKPTVQFEAANDTSPLPAVFGGHNEVTWEVTEERTQGFLAQNRQSVAPVCEELIHKSLAQEDIKGLFQASQRLPIFTQSPRMRQLELVQLSPSDLDVEDIRPLSTIRRSSHQGARSTTPQSEDQVSDNPGYGLSATSEAIADKGTIPSHFDGKVDFRDTPSPASEGSFYYRTTSRKSRGRKSSPCSHEGEAETSIAEKDLSNQESDAKALRPTDASLHHSSDLVSSGNAIGLEVQKSDTNGRIKKNGRRQHRSTLPENNLDALSEHGRVSSPDPLSEDFRDSHGQQITPNMHQGLVQNPAKPSQDDVAAIDCQRTMATQVSPTSHEESSGTQPSALRGLSQQSTTSTPSDHTEISTSRTLSTQRRLSHYQAKRSVLPAKAEDIDETTLAKGCHFNRRLSSQPESPEVDNGPTSLRNGLQQPEALAPQPIKFKGNTKPSQPPDICRRVDSSSESTPRLVDAQVLEELARSTQSPWTAVSVESLRPDLSSESRSNGSKCKGNSNITSRHLKVLPIDEAESAALSSKAEGVAAIDEAGRDEEDSFKPFRSLFKNSTQQSDKLGQPPARFPSTQTLIDAATANPWNSAFKKPRRYKSDKRVSFGPLLLEEVDNAAIDATSKPTERMESPPPPAGTLRLTQLDDPFHHKLKATRDLEVTEESLTKFMNTPWDDIPAIKPRAKPPSSSPAVAAMAEAFIAADQQSLYKRLDIKERSKPAKFLPATTKPMEKFIHARVWTAPEQPELRSSSSPDASFSIAPSGKVTAVSIEAPGCDAEDNLHAVIEDMGSFLEGWDVELELKKAKGHKFEKGSDIKAPRKREYLSGVSNR
jgi:hypothetical protein